MFIKREGFFLRYYGDSVNGKYTVYNVESVVKCPSDMEENVIYETNECYEGFFIERPLYKAVMKFTDLLPINVNGRFRVNVKKI